MTNENCRRCDAPITWSEAHGRRWVHVAGGRTCRGPADTDETIPAWWLATPAAN